MLLYQLFSLLGFWIFTAPQSVNIEVVAPDGGGEIYVAAYATPDAFDDEDETAAKSILLDESVKQTQVDLQLPAAGRYVLAGFQDLNGNGKLDKNFFGVPTEPYGFAKVPPTKWRAPAFDEIATEVGQSDFVRIELRHWDEH